MNVSSDGLQAKDQKQKRVTRHWMFLCKGWKGEKRARSRPNCLLKRFKKTKSYQLPPELSFTTVQKDKSAPAFQRTVLYNGLKRQKHSSFSPKCPLQWFKKTKAFQLSSELSFTTVQKDKSVPSFRRTVFYNDPKRQKHSSFPPKCSLQKLKRQKR